MKRYIYICVALTFFLASACQKLERDIDTTVGQDEVFSKESYTKNRLSALYADLPSGFLEVDGAMLASATDEAEHTLETSDIQLFNIGSWNPNLNPDNPWSKYFKAIRNANLFLENSDSVDLDRYKNDPSQQTLYFNKITEIKRWKYEARFLRAFYYFELIKRYGGVPIITKALSRDDDFVGIQRDSLDKCVRFIKSECDSVLGASIVINGVRSTLIPYKYADAELGRVTKGAALALKAKVFLYAASDLWNTPTWAGSYAQPHLISMQTNVERSVRWDSAQRVAKQVIDLPGTSYALHSSYTDLFKTDQSYKNYEHIFVRRGDNTNDFEKANFSIGFENGKSGTTPTENLVDAYEVIDGTTGAAVAFDWNNPTHVTNIYNFGATGTRRDPRLNANIIVNNTTYKSRTMEIWEGGIDGKGIDLATKTGYYLKKFLDDGLNIASGLDKKSVHGWPLMRLADVYLWYAEALNESNPGHADVLIYLNNVRKRISVAMPVVTGGKTQSQIRDIIRHERQVELAFEGHRFWDVRRWMIAPVTLGASISGVKIVKSGTNFQYTLIPEVEKRVFEPKMYFYPIPQMELLKMSSWSQNPLW